MKKLTGTEFAEKWAGNLKGQVENIVRGVERVDRSPTEAAAAARNLWVARMSSKDVHDRWERALKKVSLEEWKTTTATLVRQRLSGGVDAAKSKVASFGDALLSYQAANIGKVLGMPKLTLEDSRARMNAWFDIMSKFRYK